MLEVGPPASTGTVHTAAVTSRSGARHRTKNICYQAASSFNPHCSSNLPILWKEIYHSVKESHRVWSHSICYLFEFILLSVLRSNRGLDMLSKCCVSEQHAQPLKPFICLCPSLLSMAVKKTMSKSSLGRMVFIWLTRL